LGKPKHYVRAIGAGLAAAIAGGFIYAQLLALVGFGSFILAGLLGYLIGRVVRWGTHGQTQQPFTGIAIGLAVLAVAVAFTVIYRNPLPLRGLLTILAYPIAGFLALRGLQR
jgi:hypothetical protein